MSCTLKELALLAGVSVSSASRALRNHPRISADLKKRVRVLADLHGYRPKPWLSQQASAHWKPIAAKGMPLAYISTPHPYGDGLDPQYAEELRGHMERLGYHLEAFYRVDFPSTARLVGILEARGIEGVIFDQIFEERLVQEFAWDRFTTVAAFSGFFRAPTHTVRTDLQWANEFATRKALERGYCRPGFLLMPEPAETIDSFEKLHGVHFAQRLLGKKDRLPIFFGGAQDAPALRVWLARHQPDCIIAQNEMYYWFLRDMGFAVPRDLGFAVTQRGRVIGENKFLTGMLRGEEQIAKTTVEMLDRMLLHFQKGLPEYPQTILLRTLWHEGTTLPERNQQGLLKV